MNFPSLLVSLTDLHGFNTRQEEEGESKVLPPLGRHKESMCKSKERGSRTRKKKKREQPRGSRLRKRRQLRESCAWRKKIKRREQNFATFERDN